MPMPIRLPHRKTWHWWTLFATVSMTVVVLRNEGRRWFCECGQLRFWVAEAQSNHTSQHLFDPYSFSHIQHGLVLFFLVSWLARRWKWPWQLWLVVVIEAGWEILENTPMVIDRYRNATAALGYTGDSILNSLGDLLSCAIGFLLARRLGWRVTWVLFLSIETIMVITIRDSLLLNVLMLVYPLEFIRIWQLG
jgi:hypothetical protein